MTAHLRNLISLVAMALLLFGAAGTPAWWRGWALFLLFNACSAAIGLWLWKTDPDLLRERTKSPLGAGQRPRDRWIMVAIVVVLVVWYVGMALDARRFGWSHAPVWAAWLGALLIVGAFLGWVGVLRENRFAAVDIRLQPERGQTVIATGPYAIVRHPMYGYVLPLLAGTPLVLGSLWGLLGIVAVMPLLGARALGEEALLSEGLPGYRDYMRKVRYRLVPGIW